MSESEEDEMTVWRGREEGDGFKNAMLLAMKMEKECGLPPEAGENKETNSPLEPPEGTQPC